MIFGIVTGTVVATRKEDALNGTKLLIVQPVTHKMENDGSVLVAIDAVGAGAGELVLVVKGSSARQTVRTKNTPVDATIIAIVDTIEEGGRTLFDKNKSNLGGAGKA